MSRCKYNKFYFECPLESDESTDEGLCIFHSRKSLKDLAAFWDALTAYREKHRDTFIGFVFPAQQIFQRELFVSPADFSGAEFSGDTDFRNAKFSGDAKFWFVDFCGDANFNRAGFGENADFSDATFHEWAGFNGVKVNKYAYFEGTTFSENADADFDDTEFILNANFLGAAFNGKVVFRNAKFSGDAYFMNTKFFGKAYVNRAEFKEKADFRDAEFRRNAAFIEARFGRHAAFVDAEFGRNAYFRGADFSGDATFDGTKFTQNVSFTKAKFSGRTLFASKKEKNKIIQIFPGTDTGAEIDFSNTVIEQSATISFRDVDLTRCKFQGTDVRKIEFVGEKWPKIEIDKIWPKFIRQRWPESWKRFGVFDEIGAQEKGETTSYPHIEQLYRRLKQHYEDQKDYERAGDFHYGEKEMRRRNPKTSLGLKIILSIYWVVSGYGERYLRPLIWAAVLLVVCAVLYICLGLHPKHGGPALHLTSVWDWLRSAFYSFRVMTLLRPDDLAPIRFAKLVYAFESLAGPLLLGLFALAIRQRLKR